jgi:hypothetical protein
MALFWRLNVGGERFEKRMGTRKMERDNEMDELVLFGDFH